ncbi:MAG: dihydrodipicolinate reductase, partial [Nanoarchaeota archaeon]|nr:dihydrodipicolinate reductase [Nanoarchaeota archaeon]
MIRVVHQGLGPIGREIAKLVLRDEKLEIVGAVDINPEFVGKDLGDLLGIGKLDIEVVDNAEELFKRTKPDVVVLATSSELSSIMPSLEIAIKSGVNVISPAEELFYPEFIDKEKAEYIDNLAKEYKVRVVGRGINPGCLMDSYPLSVFKRSGFVEIDSMKVCRWDDTSQRRRPLLEKTGAGLSKEEFYRLDKDGKLGHVGLRMSAKYLADI